MDSFRSSTRTIADVIENQGCLCQFGLDWVLSISAQRAEKREQDIVGRNTSYLPEEPNTENRNFFQPGTIAYCVLDAGYIPVSCVEAWIIVKLNLENGDGFTYS